MQGIFPVQALSESVRRQQVGKSLDELEDRDQVKNGERPVWLLSTSSWIDQKKPGKQAVSLIPDRQVKIASSEDSSRGFNGFNRDWREEF